MKLSKGPMKQYLAALGKKVRELKDQHIQNQKSGLSGLFYEIKKAKARARAAGFAWARMCGTPVEKIETRPNNTEELHPGWCLGGDPEAVDLEHRRLIAQLIPEPKFKYLNVLVDKNLSPAQKAVQAAHAVAEYMKEFPRCWNNEVLRIYETEFLANFSGKDNTAEFYEADLNGRLTAVAFGSNTLVVRSGVDLANFVQQAEERPVCSAG